MSQPRLTLDPRFMRQALELAKLSRPSPNPRVGAVIVKEGEVVGRGHHLRSGAPHAEIEALRQAGNQARGADLYVTLEPCCHFGRTGPCVEAILAAGISRVGVGMIDPDSRVQGKGAASLRQAGIEVEVGIEQRACEQLIAGYAMHRRRGRPMFMLKAAITLDGMSASLCGDSKWISCLESRSYAHGLRAEADGVLVGVETVLKDDPELTVRLCTGPNPRRIVLDSRLRTPPDSKLVRTASEVSLVIAHTAGDAPDSRLRGLPGVELLSCEKAADGRLDLVLLAQQLGRLGLLSVLVEGGASIHGAFIRSRLADRLALFVAPKLLGSGRPWASFPGIDAVASAVTLRDLATRPIGSDLLVEALFSEQPQTCD